MSIADRQDTRAWDLSRDVSPVSIACIAYLIGYAGYALFGHKPDEPSPSSLAVIRYLTYVAPLILVAPIFTQRATPINTSVCAYLFTYLAFCAVDYLIGVRDVDYFVGDVTIISLIIVGFLPKIEVTLEQIRLLLLVSLAYFAVAYIVSARQDIRLLQMITTGSDSGLEGYDNNQGGLVGPVYTLFFYAIGARLEFGLALIMSLLGGKRIVALSLIVAIVAIFLLNRAFAPKSRLLRFVTLLLGLSAINVIGSNLILISDYLYGSLGMTGSIETVMLGRHQIGVDLTYAISNRPLLETLVGYGPGAANEVATYIARGSLTLPHNDWLKILYDYGILGSIFVTFIIAVIFSTSVAAMALALMTAVIMTTDNVTVYLFYQFPVALMIAYCNRRESNARRTADAPNIGSIEAGARR
jgi:O-antigen ligase